MDFTMANGQFNGQLGRMVVGQYICICDHNLKTNKIYCAYMLQLNIST